MIEIPPVESRRNGAAPNSDEVARVVDGRRAEVGYVAWRLLHDVVPLLAGARRPDRPFELGAAALRSWIRTEASSGFDRLDEWS